MNTTNDTKKRILTSAIDMFAQKGFNATTTAEIAKNANVAEVTLFRHFKTKKDLLHASVLEFMEAFSESFAFDSLKKVINENKDKSSRDFLKSIILDRYEFFQNYFPYIKIMVNEMQYHNDIKNLYLDKIMKKLLILGNQIVEEISKKENIKNMSSFVVIRSFIGINFMMLIQKQFYPIENNVISLEEEIDIIIDIFLNGIIEKTNYR